MVFPSWTLAAIKMLHLGFTAFVLTSLAPLGLALVYGHLHSSLKRSTAKGRAYEEACGVGGQVDPNSVGSYNACAAGIAKIDTHWL